MGRAVDCRRSVAVPTSGFANADDDSMFRVSGSHPLEGAQRLAEEVTAGAGLAVHF